MRIDPVVPQPGRGGVAIMSVVKNEARHIQDWLRFHAQAGVTDFFIYDDGSDDDTVARARALVGVNVVVVPWRMTGSFRKPQAHFSRQVLAYAHALENFGPAFRWMAFVDVDEYIVPQEAATIAEALAPLDGVTNVSLPWTMFGPNGHVDRPAVPDPFAYTTRAAVRADAILNFKCIVDPCDVSEVRIHRFQTRSLLDRTSNDIGQLSDNARRAGDFLSNSSLQLNHYFTRSDADLAEKLSKGAVSGVSVDRRRAKLEEKRALVEATAVEDLSAVAFLRRKGVHTPGDFRKLNG
jgi:glycosyltransferase involved in cell wall biosynthesis